LKREHCGTIAINTLFIDDMFEYEKEEGARRTKTRLELLMALDMQMYKLSHKRFYATGFGAPVCARELPKFKWITGADTAIASVLALSGKYIDKETAEYYKPKGKVDGDITFTGEQYDIAVMNMLILNTWASGGKPFK